MVFIKVDFSKDPFIIRIVQKMATLSGVQLNEKNRDMIESRISKYISEMGIQSVKDYETYYELNTKKEDQNLIGLLTTHHTYFFRETAHFDFLEKNIDKIVERVSKRGDKKITIWSAACSRGHEVYTLSMILDHLLKQKKSPISFEIYGTDIDPQSVQYAKNGVYLKKETDEIPLVYHKDYLAKGTGDIADYVKMKSNLTSHCQFETLNLQKTPYFSPDKKFDLIFCRNVFIYFTPQMIEQIAQNLHDYLHPEGLLFIGISESLLSMKTSLKPVAPSIYMRPLPPGKEVPSLVIKTTTPSEKLSIPSIKSVPAGPIRVLCVDDSPSILSILKKVLTKEEGFEIVGTAVDGVDAEEKMKALKVDAMTLDLHMPKKDGVTYLQDNMSTQHPPVIVISTVRRDDSDLATKALKLGVSDYVEKPSLQNFSQIGEEIRYKLKCAVKYHSQKNQQDYAIDQAFSKKISLTHPEQCIRLFCMPMAQWAQMEKWSKDWKNDGIKNIFYFYGIGELLQEMQKKMTQELGKNVTVISQAQDLFQNNQLKTYDIFIADFKHSFFSTLNLFDRETTALSIFKLGILPKNDLQDMLQIKRVHLLIEDLPENAPMLIDLADKFDKTVKIESTPMTSFFYQSKLYFKDCKK
jgi:chemotaxis protein methyltransferase CheR